MNNVTLIGRLTKDPETRYTDDNKAISRFTLAVDRPFAREKTADFLRVVVFGKTAENCERFLSKGRQVGIQGRIQTGSYKTQTGETRYTTDIVADRVEFLGSRNGAGTSEPAQDDLPEGIEPMDDDMPF